MSFWLLASERTTENFMTRLLELTEKKLRFVDKIACACAAQALYKQKLRHFQRRTYKEQP